MFKPTDREPFIKHMTEEQGSYNLTVEEATELLNFVAPMYGSYSPEYWNIYSDWYEDDFIEWWFDRHPSEELFRKFVESEPMKNDENFRKELADWLSIYVDDMELYYLRCSGRIIRIKDWE